MFQTRWYQSAWSPSGMGTFLIGNWMLLTFKWEANDTYWSLVQVGWLGSEPSGQNQMLESKKFFQGNKPWRRWYIPISFILNEILPLREEMGVRPSNVTENDFSTTSEQWHPWSAEFVCFRGEPVFCYRIWTLWLLRKITLDRKAEHWLRAKEDLKIPSCYQQNSNT